MNASVQITFTKEAIAKIAKFSEAGNRLLMGNLAATMDVLNEFTVEEIKRRLSVSGKSKLGKKQTSKGYYPFPHRISGNLRRSIGRTKTMVDPKGIHSWIGSGVGGKQAVKYSAIQEYGGTIEVPPRKYTGMERVQKIKAGRASGKHWDRRKKYKHHGYTITIPERSYLRTTIAGRMAKYRTEMSRTAITTYKSIQS